MEQLPNYADERALACCAFCGGRTGTRDHCPSRVFLDKPYPENLPVVPACAACNAGFSQDEEYVASLLSCVVAGSTDPEAMPRAKIKRILHDKPALRARIERSRSESSGCTSFEPERERVCAVFVKLAQGHALYELNESCSSSPDGVGFLPLSLMGNAERQAFEHTELPNVWPEVGSRAGQRLILGSDLTPGGWLVVQPGRYRFHAAWGSGIDVRIVIQEYLACHVHWD